jgi:type I restriction enzyme S subunit
MTRATGGVGWRSGRLQDLVFFQRGFDITQAQQQLGPYPVISSSGITSYHNEFKVNGPGVVIGRKGTLGSIHFTPGDYWPHDTTLWSKDFKENDPRFVFYLLHTIDFKRFDVGNSNPTLNRNHIHDLPVAIPPHDVQVSIASTLAAYDDLIAINRRRMALLDQAAQLLYREWFVRLSFPGHEHATVNNGILEGWARKPLAELCASIDYGYTASADDEQVGPKFLHITDIVPEVIDWSSVPHCQIEEDRLDRFRLLHGDIVVARTGATVGYAKRMNKRHPDAVFASYLVRLRLKGDVDNLMVGVFVESDDYKRYVQSRVGGAAQPNANARVLTAVEMVIPTSGMQREFREVVEPLVDQREILQEQNQKLKSARDLLLPRLMSGEIPV